MSNAREQALDLGIRVSRRCFIYLACRQHSMAEKGQPSGAESASPCVPLSLVSCCTRTRADSCRLVLVVAACGSNSWAVSWLTCLWPGSQGPLSGDPSPQTLSDQPSGAAQVRRQHGLL